MSFRERAAGNAARFRLDDRIYRVEMATPALLDALSTGGLADIVPDATDDPGRLWRRLMDPADRFDLPDLNTIGEAVTEALTGWPAHAACTLAHAADKEWPVISGRATGQGLDLLAVPARNVLAYVYSLLVESCDEDYPRHRLDRELLDRPPVLDALALAMQKMRAERGRATGPVASAAPPAARPAARPARPAQPAGFSAAEQSAAFFAGISAIGGGSGPRR